MDRGQKSDVGGRRSEVREYLIRNAEGKNFRFQISNFGMDKLTAKPGEEITQNRLNHLYDTKDERKQWIILNYHAMNRIRCF